MLSDSLGQVIDIFQASDMTADMAHPRVVTLPGSEAYSEFRQQALALQAEVDDIKGKYIHYVDLQQPLDANAQELLSNLLSDGTTPVDVHGDSAKIYYVLPRPGTISPWSSKATNIAQVCGLRRFVRRIERGIKIFVKLIPGETELTDGLARSPIRSGQAASILGACGVADEAY